MADLRHAPPPAAPAMAPKDGPLAVSPIPALRHDYQRRDLIEWTQSPEDQPSSASPPLSFSGLVPPHAHHRTYASLRGTDASLRVALHTSGYGSQPSSPARSPMLVRELSAPIPPAPLQGRRQLPSESIRLRRKSVSSRTIRGAQSEVHRLAAAPQVCESPHREPLAFECAAPPP